MGREILIRYSITHEKVMGLVPTVVPIRGTMVTSQAGARRRVAELAKTVFGDGPWNGDGPQIVIKEEHGGKVLEEFRL